MRVVHKFPMTSAVESYDFHNPIIRHVGEDPSGFDYTPCVWIERDDGKPNFRVTACFVGTGHPIPDDYEFAGTAVLKSSGFVWHVYTRMTPL